ncbi:MAG: arginine--tRNA ligase [Gammaproteobacteria bacterium]|nr:MAG: arginine--tRNA ligase [Gammaproteobacteria bacterium]
MDAGELSLDAVPEIPIEHSRDGGHGDYASPVAMGLARKARKNPREIAELIVSRLELSPEIASVEIAGPGFINFTIAEISRASLVDRILAAGEKFGRSGRGENRRVQVEFVSANPTGPLHVGHGRHAAYGAAIANLLAAVGFDVQREYYVNDAGRQMNILAVSVWLRYLQACGEELPFPANGYQGDYVHAMGRALQARDGDTYERDAEDVIKDLPVDEDRGGDKEAYIDALVARAQHLLGTSGFEAVHRFTLESQLAEIRADLEGFGVIFDRWYSERSLVTSGAIERATARLRAAGHAYEKDGAIWFRASEFGDEKDRVIIRENGQPTYFAPDIAYHMEKFERGFERVIDLLGADHHGYVARVKGALEALGENPDNFDALLMQFVTLYRGGRKMQMSTRSGEFITLRELRAEVGNDAARYFYVMRRCEQHLDFDLDLAKSRSSDNPVYYIQYAHARICSVLREAGARGMGFDPGQAAVDPAQLTESHELALLRALSRYPEVIDSAASDLEPHQLAYYLRELANDLHTYYNAHTFLVDDAALRSARLALVAATRQVLANGLVLLGVSAPEEM